MSVQGYSLMSFYLCSQLTRTREEDVLCRGLEEKRDRLINRRLRSSQGRWIPGLTPFNWCSPRIERSYILQWMSENIFCANMRKTKEADLSYGKPTNSRTDKIFLGEFEVPSTQSTDLIETENLFLQLYILKLYRDTLTYFSFYLQGIHSNLVKYVFGISSTKYS